MFRGNRLNRLSIPEPCSENWGEMAGDHRERFCEKCGHAVHDFSALTRAQADKLIRRSRGRLCGRIALNAQGKPVFAKDEPSHWSRLVQISLLGASALGSQAVAQTPRQCSAVVRVTDPSGGGVPNAAFTLDEAVIQPSSFAADGTYKIGVPEGRHNLVVRVPGFMPFVREMNFGCALHQAVKFEVHLNLPQTFTGLIVIPETGIKAHARRLWRDASAPFRKIAARS